MSAAPPTRRSTGPRRSAPGWWMLPREHGAWGMLALPFLSATALARGWDAMTLPAALAVLGAFCIREPLVVLGRQVFVWRERKPESATAARFLALNVIVLAAASALLLRYRNWRLLLALGAAAGALLVVATLLTVFNRQRSVWLQVVSAVGLSASALAAWLAVRPRLEPTAWWLWAVHSAYSTAAVLVVHARLDGRVALKRPEHSRQAAQALRSAYTAQAVLLGIGGLCVLGGQPLLALPLLLAAGSHTIQLGNLRRPDSHTVPLRRVGLRALALSIACSILVVMALW